MSNRAATVDAATPLAKRMGIDTGPASVLFLRPDSPAARSEGFDAMSRVRVEANGRSTIATLVTVTGTLLPAGCAGLSDAAWRRLDARDGQPLRLSHPAPLESLSHVRSKIYGSTLAARQYEAIVGDVAAGRYMDVHLAAFITACAGSRLDAAEVTHLTRAMVDAGDRLAWPAARVVDKHSVGGLPGNRTTPLIVAIATANGLTMPKTSSRAITSPAGTADTMETMTRVDLDLPTLRRVVELEGGCLAWGGAVSLSPADDILIRVERALDVDSEGLLVASVLSKKLAAGATDVIIDMPVGPTAKVRSEDAARALQAALERSAAALGLRLFVEPGDGSQPVGRGIGPALEAREVLAVLRNQDDASVDLRDRAVHLAGRLLEIGGVAAPGEGTAGALQTLRSGAAWTKFQAICEAQGGFTEPPQAPYRYEVFAPHDGIVETINNRVVAKIAKLAGAPVDQAAGVELHARLGDRVVRGDPLLTVHAESPGELEYALAYQRMHPEAVLLGPAA